MTTPLRWIPLASDTETKPTAAMREAIARAEVGDEQRGEDPTVRQAGIAAAGCLYALDRHVERLAQDHANARRLAEGLAQIGGITVKTAVPESNVVFFDPWGTGLSNQDFLAALAAKGVRTGQARGQIRAVAHLDVSAQDIETAIAAVTEVAASSAPGQSGRGAMRAGH